ncbi:Zinc finger C2H2 [Penicillium paradoxum]|uniref:Zinc finger C2H2 n=1 Tax=Penicillium paradoxum TaxID=176176 RepID=UPI002547F66B|nr:Zinc finger C2H2 [Penicillium paradoxum]KAJ5787620.1 Zinc finger C2H2 [Penicillium paradoxum]
MYDCGLCDCEFSDQDDCDDHMDRYDHWVECETCDRKFRTQQSCDQHMNATNHRSSSYECDTCSRTFLSQHAVNQHMNAKGHRQPSVPCDTCSRMFWTEDDADKHMEATGHHANYCGECQQDFINECCLRQHLNSGTHRGYTFTCQFCDESFVTASGVTHHLEYGSCPEADLNRAKLYNTIKELDPEGIITNSQVTSCKERKRRYFAPRSAFNGTFWECYLCKGEFHSANALNAHVNSPVHEEEIYHCLKMDGGCDKYFVSLGALFNHLESGSCGYVGFNGVREIYERLTDAIQNHEEITKL